MKKVFLSATLAATLLLATAQTAQDKKMTKKEPAKKESMQKGKEHVCTAACKDGKHVYAHGEKGHVCSDACHKKM